jgi:hypothetical protein
MKNDTRSDFKLFKKSGKYILQFNGSEDETPVRAVWVRPLSGRGKEVAFIDEKKKEIAMVDGLEHLDLDSRAVAEEAIEQRYLVTRIVRVHSAKIHFGICFWDVETDRGRRSFAMKDSYKNVIRMKGDRLVIRDTIGNRYEIESLASLDPRSQLQVEKVL